MTTTTVSVPSTFVGQRAYTYLRQATSLKWFNTGERLARWQDTLTAAYAAVADSEPGLQIPLPQGVTSASGDDTDDALTILNAFDEWLGRDVVFDALEAASEVSDTVDLGYAQVSRGVALAIARGW